MHGVDGFDGVIGGCKDRLAVATTFVGAVLALLSNEVNGSLGLVFEPEE